MSKKNFKQVRLTPDNLKRLDDYMKHNQPSPTIQNIVNFALQKFLIDPNNNQKKG